MLPALTFFLGVAAFLFGLYKWQRDLQAKRKIELAEDVLATVYEVSDSFSYIRNPFLRPTELSERTKGEKESEYEHKVRAEAYVYYLRYDKRREAFQRLRKLKYRFMAVFGKEYEKQFIEFQSIANAVLIAAAKRRELTLTDDLSKEDHNECKKMIWEGYGKPDPVHEKLRIPIQQIEEKCREEIRKQSDVWYSLTTGRQT